MLFDELDESLLLELDEVLLVELEVLVLLACITGIAVESVLLTSAVVGSVGSWEWGNVVVELAVATAITG